MGRACIRKPAIITFSLIFITLSIWVFNHPYRGLVHDARLYTLQVMSHINPVFKGDIFLKFDSQENYTVFSSLYAGVVKLMGFERANIALFIFGHLLWIAALYVLSRRFARGWTRYLVLSIAFALPSYYDGLLVFSFGEPFLTPRLFAEAFVLFSVWFMVRDNILFWGFATIIAFVFHPLVALTSIILFLVFHGMRNWKVAIGCLALLAAAVCLASVGIEPFARLLKFMDFDWVTPLKGEKGYLFLSEWGIGGFVPIITSLSCVSMYAVVVNGARRSLALSLLIASLGTLSVSFVFGDIFKNVLVMQLQLWRFEWLLIILSYFMFFLLYLKIRKHIHFKGSFIIIFIGSWLSRRQASIPMLVLLFIGSLLAMNAYLRNRGSRLGISSNIVDKLSTGNLSQTFNIFLSLSFVFVSAADIAMFIRSFYVAEEKIVFGELLPFFNAPYGLFTLTAVGGFLFWFQIKSRKQLVIVLSVLLFIFSTVLWDQRLEYEKLLSRSVESRGYLQAGVPAQAEVLWPGFTEASWFLLHRKNYVSNLQIAGGVFSRDTTILFHERTKNIGFLKHIHWQARSMEKLMPDKLDNFLEMSIKRGCVNAEDLDYVVLSHNIPKYKPVKIISMRDIRVNCYNYTSKYNAFDWYLYSCDLVRSLTH